MSRVALVPSAYLPSLGGVEELTRHLALALVRDGHEVEVWSQQADGVKASVEVMDGLRVRRFPFALPRVDPRTLAPTGVAAARSLLAMRAAAKSFRPDLLHVQCFGPNGVYATALSRLVGVPLVISLQGETIMDDHDAFDVSTSLRVGLRLGLKQARRVTGCSQFTLDDAIARFGLRPGAGTVIFNGVALADQPASTAAVSKVEGRYVLALGRVVVKKGFDLLIRAFQEVATRHPDVTLAIGGSGRQEEALQRLVGELGLEGRVRFLGRLTRTEVASTMAGAEAFVMPSRLEPFGIVVLEAWRAGRATIATSRGGPPEFVDEGETGLLADPFDTAALAAALDRVLSDPGFGRALGEAARRRVADFDWPAIATRYERVYADVLADPRGGSTHSPRSQ